MLALLPKDLRGMVIRRRISDIDLFVGDVEIAAQNDVFFLLEAAEIRAEIVFPHLTVVKSAQTVL